MAEIKFYDRVDDSKISFAVIVARMGGKWVLCKHKDRNTYELPGGHRENGESIRKTAEREFQEETGAVKFSMERICDYSVRGVTREGEELDEETFGTLYRANIITRTEELRSEIEKVILMVSLPNNWTYPTITPKLINKALIPIVQSENGTAYFLVHDKDLARYQDGNDSFINWLLSEGFKFHEFYQSTCTGVWVNLNYKIIACGKPGIRCFEEIGHHAISIDEFKTIYEIYKKYEGKGPFVFD